MRKFAVLGASALVLALGVATASAEPFNPVTGYNGSAVTPAYGYTGSLNEGRAANEGSSQFNSGWTTGNPVLQLFHAAGR
jgi:hypothetical protein